MKWEAISGAIAICAFMGMLAYTDSTKNKADAEIKISCNNLRAAAVAASQPTPVCSL
jgi:hypothetical protein